MKLLLIPLFSLMLAACESNIAGVWINRALSVCSEHEGLDNLTKWVYQNGTYLTIRCEDGTVHEREF